MSRLLTPARSLALWARVWGMLLVMALSLAGCGGGGGGGSTNGGSSGGGSPASPATLTGVVAVGAPLIGATVSVVDARGVAQGNTISTLADGSYELTLSSGSPTLPLFIEASGVDMYGNPVVVHTVVQSLTAGSNAKTVAHVNPLTNAVVGLLLGGDPRPHFMNAASRYASWTLLGNSAVLAAATTYVKTAIKSNLTDAKLTDLTKVDFFKDATFTANKTGLDAAIEAVRVQFTTDIAGNEVLQLSNRLILAGNSEVAVNLTLARSNLAGSTPAISTAAVTSTLKATTGNSALMPYVSGLNTLAATINLALAQKLSALEIAALPVFSSSYTYFDGLNGLSMASKLSGYGTSNYQLSSWQILGCLDDPMPSKGCSKIRVASLVRNSSGDVVDVFHNVVTYATATGWTLRGNDRQTPWYIHPITWAVWDATGVLNSAVSPNPGLGMQVVINSLDYMIATLQLPNGYAVAFSYCSTVPLEPMCLGATETGDLISDQVLRSTMVGWIGSYDAKPGARYTIQTTTLSSGSENNSTLLTTDLPSTASMSVYPLPDNLSASAPLTVTNLVSGLAVAWDSWAAANPQLRMIEVRAVVTSTSSAPVSQSAKIMPLADHSVTLPAFSSVPSDAVAYHLWLIAQDEQGRRYVSKIAATP